MNAQPLNYATPGAPDDSRPRYPWPLTAVMVAGVIAFFAVGGWGMICIDEIGVLASVLMIVAASMFMIVVFGLLSRRHPRFIAAAIMALCAAIAVAIATFVTHAATVALQERITAQSMALGKLLVISSASEADKSLGILQFARFVNASATLLSLGLFVYLAIQTFHRRPTWG